MAAWALVRPSERPSARPWPRFRLATMPAMNPPIYSTVFDGSATERVKLRVCRTMTDGLLMFRKS